METVIRTMIFLKDQRALCFFEGYPSIFLCWFLRSIPP